MTIRRRFRKSNGAHYYNGKHGSRGKRLLSKIHAGIKPVALEVFEQVKRQLEGE